MLEMTQEFGRLAVFERNLRTGVARWSAPMFRLLGQPPSSKAPPFLDALSCVHPDDRAVMAAALRDTTQAAGVHEVRFRVNDPDGRTRHMHSRYDVRLGADGTPERVVGVIVDDTETVEHLQQQARAVEAERERARDLSHRIELVIAAVGVGLWTIDIETDRLEWTAPMYRLYGVGPEGKPDTMGELTQRYVHPDDRSLIRAQRANASAPGEGSMNFVFRIVRPDGEVRALSTWSRREIAANGRLTAYGVTMDVTDQLAAQQRLKDLDASALLAAESAGIGTWETDVASGQSHWSAQMYRLRGHAPDCGLTPLQMREATHHPDDTQELRAKIAAAVDAGDDYEHEFRVRWPDGSVHWLASRGIARRDSAGRVTRLIGVNWEVTERKRAEEALRDKASAERASRAKSEFLSRMSHELRTPLNAVIGFTQLLLGEGGDADPAQRRQRLLQVDSAGLHLLALIDDVLDVATIESSTLKLERRPVALRPALEDALQWVRELAQRAGVTLHLGPVDGRVRADERRLRQIVSNLLSNAVKYNRRGGEVWLSAHADTLAGAPAWAIRVRDTGRGLDAMQRAHLFEPFNRLGAERENIPGTGIGLVIVHHLVEHMGGHIDVDSHPGQGSTFTLRLPAAPHDPAPAATAAAAPGAPPGEASPALATRGHVAAARDTGSDAAPPVLTLLYIEDNPVNALLVAEIVAMRPGLHLRGAADGQSGVALALEDPPDVALVDMQLPDIDGTEVLARLRADPRLAHCRVIALSASAMPEDVRRALASGFDDYWTKPIDVNRFLAALDALGAAAPR
jgi:PAS domain S-box-containing protein